MLVNTVTTTFWTVFAALGFAALFNMLENLGRRYASKTRQLGVFRRELPMVFVISALMLVMRMINASMSHSDMYWLMINIQLIFMIYTDLMLESTWSFLIIKIFGILSIADTGGLNPVTWALFLGSGLAIFLESHYSRNWSPDNPVLFALPPIAIDTLFWLAMYVGYRPSNSTMVANFVGFIAAFTMLFLNSRTQRADQQIVKRLTHEVQFDALTGVRNWSMFQNDFNSAYANVKKDWPLAILTMDLDNFKGINDTFGHLAGNQALTTTASSIERLLQSIDHDYHLYRTGGEEFAIILPHTDADMAQVVAKQCQDVVRTQVISTDAGKRTMTASFGLTQAIVKDRDATTTFKRADQALYTSKREGRDRLTVDFVAVA
ncbi:GGDEF domain-containing protein [Lacticaseibacillus songhuajiangensis]|jgi:diguanylate cyclase (GGDEF)-like protein|uniref:GGDEF domain-containing protein n=1 Tax=Lacticaseibacillus songhuajiangensis TaxID=1296539 RepID=UPI000F7AEA73|nr:diguanylate cyclase [Lacticaseibacillus songhuajiangensis]